MIPCTEPEPPCGKKTKELLDSLLLDDSTVRLNVTGRETCRDSMDWYYTCQVFILTPVSVLCMETSRTVTFETQALALSFPSPPTLIPCPGPQLTLCIYTFEHPVCIDMQSSPVECNNI